MYSGLRSRVRALHASPGVPPVDVYIEGALTITGLAYGQLSDYAELRPGRHRLQVFPAGAHGQTSPLIDDRLEELQPGEDNTVLAVGERQDMRALLLHDNTLAPGREEAKVRVVHASPDAPAIDVGITGNPRLFARVPFERATRFKVVEAGTVELEMRSTSSGERIVSLPEYPLVGGKIYTFVALGLLGGRPGFTIMPIVAALERCVPARSG